MIRLRLRLASPCAAVLSAALLGACYDTPLIPAEPLAAGGSAGRAGDMNLGGTSAAGSGAANAGAGSPMNAGGASGVGGSGHGAGTAGTTGSAGTMGAAGTTGQAGSSGAPSVTWLELSGSTAPASFASNAALGINGSFYAYADGCSTLTWDESTRCASGMLCDPAKSLDNWGMAVGFDFHNTGVDGTPPNTKLIWNPNEHGALGVAWRIRNNAPKLQVWVLNMAPSWQGQCSAMTCEIAGPPDGVAPAALSGELLFGHMIKDNWGGSGVQYTFDRRGACPSIQARGRANRSGRLQLLRRRLGHRSLSGLRGERA